MKRSKKILLGLASTIFALVCCFTMASCEVNSVKFKVDFDSNGGSEVADIEIDKDAKITMPENPTRTGYTFVGWFIDDVEFSATTPITSDVKIVAKWSANSYSVTLNKDGGVVTTDLTTYTYGVGATLPVPTKDGYTFGGWFDNDGFTGNAVTSIGATELENKVFYAKWDILSYSVSFDVNGGEGTIATQTINYNAKATKPTDPTREGYDFLGWFVTGSQTAFSFDTVITDNVSLKAKWNESVYSITLNNITGATCTQLSEYVYGEGAELPTPTKTGYDFDGWYANAEFTGDTISEISSTATGDKVFYAKWTAIVYQVSLNLDNGTINSGNVETYTYGVGATLPTDITKIGYTFAGWYDNAELTGTAVTAIADNVTGAKTFYAKWTANTYTVTLNYNDATSNGTPLTSYTYGVGATLPTDAQKTDYELKGWYDNAEFTGDAITAISATDTGNKTYFAKWGLPTFEVSINLDGGAFADATAEGIVEGVKSVEINTKVSEIFTTNPAKDGFNFVRWQYADGSEIGSNDTVTEAIEIKAFFRSTSLLADFELNNDGTTRFGMENATALVQGQGTSEVSNDWASTGSYSLKITQPDTNSWAGLQYSSEVTVEGGFNVVRFSLKSSKKVSNFVIEFYSNGWKASNKIVVEEGEGTYFAKLSAKITSFTKFEVYTVAGITYYIDDITFATAYEHAEGTVADFEFDGIEENYTSGATYYNNAGNISISDEWSVGEGSKYSLKIECDGDAWAGIKMPSYTTKIFDTISFDLKSSVEISQYTIEFQNGTYAWYEFKVDVKVGENHFDIDLEKFYPGFDTIEFYVNSAYGTLYIDNIKLTCSEALPAYQRAEGTIADFEPNGDILLYGYGHDGFTFNNSVAYNSISNEWSSTGLFSFKVRSQNDGWSGLNSTTGIAVPAFDTISFKVYATVAVTGWAFDLKTTSTGGWKEFTVDLVEGENTITHTFDNKYAVYYGFECRSKFAYGTFYIDDIVLTDSNPIIFERPVGSVGDFEKNGDVTNYGFSDGYSAYEDGSACEVSVTTEWANTGSYSLKVKTTGNGWAGIQASAKDAPFAYNMVKFTMKSPVAHSQTEFYLMSGSTWILFNVDIEEGVHTYVCELPSTYTQYNSFLFKADTSWNAGQTFYVDDIILINFTRQAGSVGDFEKNGDVANFGFSDGYESYAATVSQVSVTNEWANTGAYSLKVIPIGGGWAGIKCAAKNAPLEYNIVTFTMKSPIAHSNTTFYVMSGTAWPVFKVDIEEGVHTYVCKLDNTYSKYNAFIFEAGEWNNGLVFYIDDIILSNFTRAAGSVGDYEEKGEIAHYGYGHDGFVFVNSGVATESISDEWASNGQYSFKVVPTGNGWAGIKNSTGITVDEWDTISFDVYASKAITGWQFEYACSSSYLINVDLVAGINHVSYKFNKTFTVYKGFDCRAINTYGTYYIDNIVLSNSTASTTFERQTGSVGDYEQNGEIDHYGYDGFVKYNESAGNITVSDEWSNTGDYSLKFNPLSTQGDWLGIKASSGNGIAITYNTVTFTMNSEIDMTGLQFYIYGASNQYKLFTLDIQKGVHTYTANLGVEYASYYSFMFKADSTNAGKIFYIDDIILTKVDA